MNTRKAKHWKLALRLAVLTFALTGIVQAQYGGSYTNPYTGNTFNNAASSFIDTIILHNRQRAMLMNSLNVSRNSINSSLRRGGLKLSKQQKAQTDHFAKYRGTMFKAAKPVMPSRLATQLLPDNPEQQKNLAKVFGVLLKFYEDRSKQQRAPSTDLARTLSYCIAMNYAYSTEQDVSAKGLVELRRKMREAMTSDPKFRALSDAKKQELSEALVIMTHFVALGYDEAKAGGKKEDMAKFKQLAQANLQSMLGVPVQQVKLEHTGLVITK